ncbi:MAG: hypothetical protein V4685_07900 [Bacteroidota bacterium]
MANNFHTYYLAETYGNDLHTASIVRKVNEMILSQMGFSELKFLNIKDGSVIVKLRRLSEVVKLALSVKKNSLVVFHFPLLASAYAVLLRVFNKRGIRTAAIIIDIDGLRYKDEKLLKKELETLKEFNYIIAHNDAMKDFLSQHITADKISCINLFDYPADKTVPEKKLSNTVCFAGNFEKATFVNDLDKMQEVNFNLYGQLYTGETKKNICYKGVFPPSELPQKLEGSFGILWDGDSIENCDDYLQYNNPHKLSLYIAAGLPVIVWQKSAVAKFVEENNIGITINSLTELNNKINNISLAQYELMKKNIEPLRSEVINGSFLNRVITAMTSNLSF